MCKKCGSTEVMHNRRVCRACFAAGMREHRAQKTPEQRELARVRSERWRDNNREKVRRQNKESEERQKLRDPEAFAQRSRDKSRKLRQARRAMLHEAKSQPCSHCGVQYPPAAMDLHHRDPASKNFNPSSGLNKPLAVLKAEIAKCDVICAVCHRLHHAE